jgi:acetyl esterase/lipase
VGPRRGAGGLVVRPRRRGWEGASSCYDAEVKPSTRDPLSVVSLVVTSLLAGCGAGAGTGGGGAGGGGAGGGGAGGAGPAFPEPSVAGTPQTDALADAPERCGMPPYQWLRGESLGQVIEAVPRDVHPASVLQVLVDAAGVPVPPMNYDVESYVVTYQTQDRGALVDATALVAWPTSAPAGTVLPTLLFLHGTSGFTDGCGPSGDDEAATLAAALASIGYVVVAPDYLGLKGAGPATGFPHPYLVGEATAIASLDAVRSLGGLSAQGLGGTPPSPRVAVFGGSQGGHAALWVERLAPYYARELEIVGVAATVPPSDMVGQGTLALQSVRSSTGNMMAFYGVSAAWYGLSDRLDELFVPPLHVAVPAALTASCDPSDAITQYTELEQVFQPGVLAAAAADTLDDVEPWGCLLRENGLVTSSVARISADAPSHGVLFVTGEGDSLVDTPTERAAFVALCAAGLPSTYLECAGASHTQTSLWALPTILEFLAARVSGEPFVASCEVTPAVACPGQPAD